MQQKALLSVPSQEWWKCTYFFSKRCRSIPSIWSGWHPWSRYSPHWLQSSRQEGCWTSSTVVLPLLSFYVHDFRQHSLLTIAACSFGSNLKKPKMLRREAAKSRKWAFACLHRCWVERRITLPVLQNLFETCLQCEDVYKIEALRKYSDSGGTTNTLIFDRDAVKGLKRDILASACMPLLAYTAGPPFFPF